METFEDRLHRFLSGSPNEIFLTILNSISNFTLDQLRRATEAELYDLALLGAHAVAQTVAEQIYGRTGLAATKFYLENFVGGDVEDRRFSLIAKEFHHYRNVHAHRWSSRSSHSMGFDVEMEKGWVRDTDGLHVNPRVFMEGFATGFGAGGPMWTMPRALDRLSALRRKYRYLGQWLELEPDDPIFAEIRALDECKDAPAAITQEGVIRARVLASFGLGEA